MGGRGGHNKYLMVGGLTDQLHTPLEKTWVIEMGSVQPGRVDTRGVWGWLCYGRAPCTHTRISVIPSS